MVRSFSGTYPCCRGEFLELCTIRCLNPFIYATYVQTDVPLVLVCSPLNSMSDPGTPSVEGCTCLSGYVQSEPGAICFNPDSGPFPATSLRLCSQSPCVYCPFQVLPPLHLYVRALACICRYTHTGMLHRHIYALSLFHAHAHTHVRLSAGHIPDGKIRAECSPVPGL